MNVYPLPRDPRGGHKSLKNSGPGPFLIEMTLERVGRDNQGHRVVPILGMHRSGTSLLTRMLAALGLDLGAALQPPAQDNPRGFWEHRFFQQVNMRLLSGLQCDPDGFALSPDLTRASDQATRYAAPLQDPVGRFIAANFGGGIWGFKDPRTCLTWRFWQTAFARLGIDDVRPVVVLRAPAPCVQSLLRRGDHRRPSLAQTGGPGDRDGAALLRLYADYYALLERHAPGESLWLAHSDLTDPRRARGALAACCDHLGLHRSGIGPALATLDRELLRPANSPPYPSTAPAAPAGTSCAAQAALDQYHRLLPRTRRNPPPRPLSQPTPPAPTLGPRPDRKRAGLPDCIYVVSPHGYDHSRAFDELALTLHHGLADLGAPVPVVTEPFEVGERPIVLGPQLLTRQGAPDLVLPEEAILFNLEQIEPGSPWCTDGYRALLERHRVWDYSPRNLRALADWGVHGARLCEPGYHPAARVLQALPDGNQDIDVLFYGTLCPRRQAVLSALDAAGLRVTHLFGVYGARRDDFIRRAKVCLNLHHYGAQVLEVVRLNHLLHNGVCVVSEPDGANGDHPLHAGLWLADYAGIVDACREAVSDTAARRARAAAGLAILQRTSITDSLRHALAG